MLGLVIELERHKSEVILHDTPLDVLVIISIHSYVTDLCPWLYFNNNF